jgi:hypothetical protein
MSRGNIGDNTGDPGDKYDSLKWDFDETSGYNVIDIDGYPYKVLSDLKPKYQKRIAEKLHCLRLLTNEIADNIGDFAWGPGIDIFEYIHRPGKDGTSNYLLSGIKTDTGFEGLNKPKGRIRTEDVNVGPDKNLRARWRDIFLLLNYRNPMISKDELDLYVHELAHTGANHVTFRPDDHNLDFTSFEDLIWNVINKLNLKKKYIN